MAFEIYGQAVPECVNFYLSAKCCKHVVYQNGYALVHCRFPVAKSRTVSIMRKQSQLNIESEVGIPKKGEREFWWQDDSNIEEIGVTLLFSSIIGRRLYSVAPGNGRTLILKQLFGSRWKCS